jgi:hypothetical protein
LVIVAVLVAVGVEVFVTVLVAVGVQVFVEVFVAVGVLVGNWVRVAVGFFVGVDVFVAMGLPVGGLIVGLETCCLVGTRALAGFEPIVMEKNAKKTNKVGTKIAFFFIRTPFYLP